MSQRSRILSLGCMWLLVGVVTLRAAEESTVQHRLWSTAYAIPKELTSEGSGYFSIVEGKNGKLYIGTAKYRHNCYLVEFDPQTKAMKVVVDAHKEIGTTATGFAAQAKFHTRNNVGESGRIYLGTKQGYPEKGEQRTDYPGGYPLIYDPATGKTRVYDIPIKHQGIISVTPDESRNVAYISTCSDERPIESTHFMKLDLATGKYQDLLDCRHMYAFIVVDHLGRAYHPILGGEIARYDPRTDKLERLKQTIDGAAPTKESLLAHPESQPLNWDISPDRKSLYCVSLSGNQLYRYDLTAEGDTLAATSLGKLISNAKATDCRALCVAPDGTVWAGINATFEGRGDALHVVSYRPGQAAPTNHGPIAISNPNYTSFKDDDGKDLPWHHGVYLLKDGTLVPRYVVMGICGHSNGNIYVTTLAPFTLHEIRIPKIAGITTEYRHNSHGDMLISRMLQSDTLDGQGEFPRMKLASIHTDQVPKNDISHKMSEEYHVPLFPSVAEAITLGGSKLAVDGILVVDEHGKYPKSEVGQTIYPKRRMFEEIVAVTRQSGRSVPVFFDKHLSDNWTDAKWIYDTARAEKIPLMAGSSVPGGWRTPPIDVKRGAKLKQIVMTSYHLLDVYGFHSLEVLQALAERRAGGETGIRRVQAFAADQMWQTIDDGVCDQAVLDAAIGMLTERRWEKTKKTFREATRGGSLVVIDYNDGLRACLLTADGAVSEWTGAWSYADDGKIEATRFEVQEARPFYHFAILTMGIERLMQTGTPHWPVERTLLTSGALHIAHQSLHQNGKAIDTPFLNVTYKSDWNWQQPAEQHHYPPKVTK